MKPDPSLAQQRCQTCGNPAFPHPYRHPVTLAAPPAAVEQAEQPAEPLPAYPVRLHVEIGVGDRRQLAAALREIAHVVDNDPTTAAPQWALRNTVPGGEYRADCTRTP